MVNKRQITENLDIDLDTEKWCCNRCGLELISARENYKEGCLLYERNPVDIHEPVVTDNGELLFCPDPKWVAIIEFYCPGCGGMIETELLPLGHPITHDIELDIDTLKIKAVREREGG